MDSLLFPMAEYWWLYAGFLGFVGLMLALDLGVFHRKAHAVSFKEATFWSVFWISLSLACNWAFYEYALHRFSTDPRYFALPGFDPSGQATRVGLEFLTGFAIEKALAVDNLFVFVLVFSAFRIPPIYQHRVLFLGILGAIAFRSVFIALGAQLMAYHWVVVLFGALLVLTGIKMAVTGGKHSDPAQGWPMRLLRRFVPISNDLDGRKLVTVRNGARHATPLLLALVFIEVSDVIFALDSVPAIFAITREPMIVFISNILAILGMRSLYFMLAGVVDRFVYLKYGLSAVLVFVGLKMAWLNEASGGEFPIGLSLAIIATLILGSILVSLLATSGKKRSTS